MIYDLTVKLKNLDGSVSDETMGNGFRNALLSDVSNSGQPVGADVKRKRYQLFVKIANKTSVDMSIEEVALLKDAVWIFPTLSAGQLDAFLEKN